MQPLSLAYVNLNGLPLGRAFRSRVAWYGDADLIPHLIGVCSAGAVDVTVVGDDEDGHPAGLLLSRSTDADLLVVGARGHGGFSGLLAGSVTVGQAFGGDLEAVTVHGSITLNPPVGGLEPSIVELAAAHGEEALAKSAFGNTKEMMRIFEELTGVDLSHRCPALGHLDYREAECRVEAVFVAVGAEDYDAGRLPWPSPER